ncbi:hypothetical protein ER57_08450 [Smithella sp. SCADC]|jgi:hypothetical protein|nr:hypothetical protein ER57_08450 [Smithella sp. SCADC]HAR49287.1 hypothetical protein [Smithella sp.]
MLGRKPFTFYSSRLLTCQLQRLHDTLLMCKMMPMMMGAKKQGKRMIHKPIPKKPGTKQPADDMKDMKH